MMQQEPNDVDTQIVHVTLEADTGGQLIIVAVDNTDVLIIPVFHWKYSWNAGARRNNAGARISIPLVILLAR